MDAMADARNGASLLLRDFRAWRVLSNAVLPVSFAGSARGIQRAAAARRVPYRRVDSLPVCQARIFYTADGHLPAQGLWQAVQKGMDRWVHPGARCGCRVHLWGL